MREKKHKELENGKENKCGYFASCPPNNFSVEKSKTENKPLNIDNC